MISNPNGGNQSHIDFKSRLGKLEIPEHTQDAYNKNIIALKQPTRSALLVLKLLEILRSSNLDPSLYANLAHDKIFSDEEVDNLSNELSIPLFRYIFDGNRVEKEFIIRREIGRGGFGTVFHVQHRVDGNDYAVKRIRFSFRNNDQLLRLYRTVIREVQALSRIDHPNVVRYNSCWFEPVTKSEDGDEDDIEFDDELDSPYSPTIIPPKGNFGSRESDGQVNTYGLIDNLAEDEEYDGELQFRLDINQDEDVEDGDFIKDEISDGVQFDFDPKFDDSDDDDQPAIVGIPASPGNFGTSEKESFFLRNYGARPKQNEVQTPSSWINMLYDPNKKRYQMDLYIQMALCSNYTLEDYLWSEERVTTQKVDYDTCMKYFCHIIQGLCNIHKCGLVHRDIKPTNCFLAKDDCLKIGDFGLAKSVTEIAIKKQMQAEEDVEKLERKRSYELLPRKNSPTFNTSNIGTITYASPEQLRGEAYDEAVDMYSVGVILFELLSPFSTKLERAKILTKLKSCGDIPDEMFEKYHDEMKIVQKCISGDPKDRPSANEVFVIVDAKYRAKTDGEKDKLIKQQKLEILQLKKELKKLRRKNNSSH